MNPTAQLRSFGQSLWLDNITRDLLNSGTLKRYIADLSITLLTSNPTIFDHAIKNSHPMMLRSRKALVRVKAVSRYSWTRSGRHHPGSRLFRAIHDQTNGVDGWVSLEVPPSLAYDATKTLSSAKELFARAARPNVFIKIPGTKEGLQAIEDAIFAGVPINVTLLFSADQYVAAAYAYLRGVERRVEAGLNPVVASVASVFISRWDVAVTDKVPESLRGKLGVTMRATSMPNIKSFWIRDAGSGRLTSAHAPSAFYGQALERRIPSCQILLHQTARRAIHHKYNARRNTPGIWGSRRF